MRLKVVSWNIRKAVGLDWRRDPARVLDVLATLDADVALLQEADKRLHPRPPALPEAMMRAAGWTWLDADPLTPSIGHHGNAVLLRPGLRVTAYRALDLRGLEPRGAVLARVEGSQGAMTLGALHLGLRATDRRRQIAQVVAAATDFAGPVLLAGDTNEWRQGGLPLPPGWRDLAPGNSFHAARPLLSLDRFLLGPGVTSLGHGVLPPASARRASDHLPIWIAVDTSQTPA